MQKKGGRRFNKLLKNWYNGYMEKLVPTIKKLEKDIKKIFDGDNTGHDIYHLKRVYNLAMHIQKKEGGDAFVIGVAAFLHDMHRVMIRGRYCTPKESLPRIKLILGKMKIREDKLEKILHCIEFHEEYDFSKKKKTVEDIETLIVQDADNLDAMGAVGIGRTFNFSGAHGIPMWLPDKPFTRKHFDESKPDISTIHHFYSKMLRLKDNMNTKTAKKMAIRRDKVQKVFLEEFIKEWQGNN